MNNDELYEQVRKRYQRNYLGKCFSDKEIITEQEKEIKHYRERINKFLDKSLGIENSVNDLNKELEIGINNEDYLIKYNNNTDIVKLMMYVNKLINDSEINMICSKEEFKIYNKTRIQRYENKFNSSPLFDKKKRSEGKRWKGIRKIRRHIM